MPPFLIRPFVQLRARERVYSIALVQLLGGQDLCSTIYRKHIRFIVRVGHGAFEWDWVTSHGCGYHLVLDISINSVRYNKVNYIKRLKASMEKKWAQRSNI